MGWTLPAWSWAEESEKKPKDGIAHESEVGVVIIGGNSKASTYNAKQMTGYRFGKNELTATTSILLGTAASNITTRYWTAGIRYDRYINDRLSLFAASLWEGDTFSGYEYRINMDLGAKYYWIQAGDNDYAFNELGYRYRNEHTIDASVIISHFARVYTEAAKSINDRVFAKIYVEILPDLADTENYQVNFEPSLRVSLSSALALKLAYQGRFDNKPAVSGLEKFDYKYSTALIAKF